jgi:2-oxo-4-hydroxy-4-carboxy-5-ureidoimidazoline decarboxylase
VTAPDGSSDAALGQPMAIAELDAANPADAAAELMPCCASRRWVSELVGRRPYGTFDALRAASEEVLAALDWVDIEQALSAHPRIGERVTGPATEAAWSRSEQAGAADVGAEQGRRLLAVNQQYERKFGYVFLICASGQSAAQMIRAAETRLGNDPFAERAVVAGELAKIVRLRLAKAFQ